jgi:hypothetical protein
LLEFMKAPQDDAFPVGKPVMHIREIIMRVTGRHGSSMVITEDFNADPIPSTNIDG